MLLSKNVTGGGQNLGKNWQAVAQNNLCKSASSNLKLFALILINKIEKIWIESEEIPPSPPPSPKLKKKKAGTIVIEVVFTLPLVFYLIFFCVELIRINIVNDALQTICEEATFLTSAHNYESGSELVAKIDAIVEKHRPRFIPEKAVGYNTTKQPVIRWNIGAYTDMQQILKNIPYGGSCMAYMGYEFDVTAAEHASQGWQTGETHFVPILGQEFNQIEDWKDTKNFLSGSGIPDDYAFIINFSCNYQFSSGMTKLLFNGGVNTKVHEITYPYNGPATNFKDGKFYLLYARGAGIVGKSK